MIATALCDASALPEVGVNFIDTANSYGPDTSELLIREALHPYSGLVIATKAGLVRTGPDAWHPLGRPEYLIQEAYRSAWKLGVEQIDLWQLHRIDPHVRAMNSSTPSVSCRRRELSVMRASEVKIEEIEAARKYSRWRPSRTVSISPIAAARDVLDYCTENGIGFIPWFPLAAGRLTQPGSILSQMATQKGVSASQSRSPGRRSAVRSFCRSGHIEVTHLEENVAACRRGVDR